MHEGNSAAYESFGCDVSNYHAIGAPGEAAIRDESYRIPKSFSNKSGSGRKHFSHTGSAFRSLIAYYDHVTGLDFARKNSGHAVFFRFKYPCRAGYFWRFYAGDFGHAPFGREISLEYGEVTLRIHGVFPLPDDILILAGCGGNVG